MDGAAAMPAEAVAGAAGAAAAYLRIGEAGDAVLVRAAATALALAEAFCGQLLIVRACEQRVAAGGGWQRLANLPVRSIALAAEAGAMDIDVHGIGWVRLSAATGVQYSAGLAAAWEALPEPVMQGVVLLAAHLFEHREGDATPPAAVAALWRPYRRMRL